MDLNRWKRLSGVSLGLLTALSACAVVTGPHTSVPDLGLTLPAGFHAALYAGGFKKPRLMASAPNGDVFVADEGTDQVIALLDRNRDGQLDRQQVYATGLNKPNSLAFHGNFLYVANTDGIVRFPYASGDIKASAPAQKIVDLPGGGLHSSRTVVFGPDGHMYVAAGSNCNVCEETDPKRASVWIYDADGQNGRPFATGLRNAVGLEWFAGTLYATVNGRDLGGNDTPPESFYTLSDGGNYGWPYCYPLARGVRQTWDKAFGKKDPTACGTAEPAFATTTAHAAPLGLAFYTGQAFPAAYRNKMFVALHGSWNRFPQSGYKVITVDPQTGQTSDFITGFLKGVTTSGRPADLQMTADGALLLTDDSSGVIYRISYGATP